MKIQICSVNRIAFLFIVLVGFIIKRLSAKTVNFLFRDLDMALIGHSVC